jgi:fibronectin-binding autotransporter adhesin
MKRPSLLLVSLLAAAAPVHRSAADLYWDLNLDAAGAGTNPTGTWDAIAENWNADASGLSLPGLWTAGETAFFSAGNDATGPFTVNITGTQTAAGVNIEEGTVIFAGGTAAVGTGVITINAGAALSINSSARISGSAGATVSLNGGTIIQTNPSNALSFIPAAFNLEIGAAGGTVNYTSSGAGTISIYGGATGTIIGTGTLTKTGPGEFRYQGLGLPNTTYSKLVVNQGLFRLGFNSNIQDERGFGAEPAVFTPDAITLSGGGSIATSFLANLSVLHPNRGITLGTGGGALVGPLTVTGGITGSGSLTTTGPATINQVVLGGVNTYTGITTVSTGILQFVNEFSLYTGATSSWTDTNIVVNSGATLAFNVGGAGEFTPSDVSSLLGLGTAIGGFRSGSNIGLDTTNATGENFTYSGIIANPNAGANMLGLRKLGTNTLTLPGANTYTGGTAINGGVLSIASIGNGGTASGIGASSNAAANLVFIGSSTLQYTGPDASTDRGFTIGATRIATFDIANTLTISGPVPTSSGGVGKIGAGMLVLAGANAYTGATTISGGTLRASASNTALGFGGTLTATTATVGKTVVDGTIASATLDLAGVTVNEPITLNGDANGASLINSNTSTAARINNGVAGIQFSSAGTAYIGTITVTLSGGGGSGATATATAAAASPNAINGITTTAAGTGYTSAPTVTITGSTSGSGANATAVLSSVTLSGTNNSIGGAGDLIIAAAIGESTAGSGFTKIGAGTVKLNGTNTYTGETTVTAGTLEFGVSQTLASLTIANGAMVRLAPSAPGAAPVNGFANDGPSDNGPFAGAASAVTTPAQAVPEPGVLCLLTAGALGLLDRRRRCALR